MDPPLHSGVKSAAEWTVASENCPKWPMMQTLPYFWMRKVFCSSITLRKEEPSIWILYSIIDAFESRNYQKTATNEEEKSALLTRQYKSITTMAKVHELHFKLLPG